MFIVDTSCFVCTYIDKRVIETILTGKVLIAYRIFVVTFINDDGSIHRLICSVFRIDEVDIISIRIFPRIIFVEIDISFTCITSMNSAIGILVLITFYLTWIVTSDITPNDAVVILIVSIA